LKNLSNQKENSVSGKTKLEETPEKRLYIDKDSSHKPKSKSISQSQRTINLKEKSRNGTNDSKVGVGKLKSSRHIKSIFGPSHVGDGILYSVKGQHRYKGSIISKPKRESILKDTYRHLEMGVVGEPIISTGSRIKALRKESNRKNLQISSLDTRLPRIGDDPQNSIDRKLNPTTKKNLKLPTLAKSSKKLIGIYGDSVKSNKNLKYKYRSNSRYKYYGKSKVGGSNDYLSKVEHSKSVNMINIQRQQ